MKNMLSQQFSNCISKNIRLRLHLDPQSFGKLGYSGMKIKRSQFVFFFCVILKSTDTSLSLKCFYHCFCVASNNFVCSFSLKFICVSQNCIKIVKLWKSIDKCFEQCKSRVCQLRTFKLNLNGFMDYKLYASLLIYDGNNLCYVIWSEQNYYMCGNYLLCM